MFIQLILVVAGVLLEALPLELLVNRVQVAILEVLVKLAVI
jgi:hypothetical protein